MQTPWRRLLVASAAVGLFFGPVALVGASASSSFTATPTRVSASTGSVTGSRACSGAVSHISVTGEGNTDLPVGTFTLVLTSGTPSGRTAITVDSGGNFTGGVDITGLSAMAVTVDYEIVVSLPGGGEQSKTGKVALNACSPPSTTTTVASTTTTAVRSTATTTASSRTTATTSAPPSTSDDPVASTTAPPSLTTLPVTGSSWELPVAVALGLLLSGVAVIWLAPRFRRRRRY